LGSAVRLADRPKENRKLTLSGEYQAPEFLVDDGASSENSAAELLSGQRILLAKLILATGIWLRCKIQGKLKAYTDHRRVSTAGTSLVKSR
jgi:hypothetical protein